MRCTRLRSASPWLSPRLDYQLRPNHTLSARYSFTDGDIDGDGIGGFDAVARSYRMQFTHHTAQIAGTAVIGTAVTETRFQSFRDVNQPMPFAQGAAIQLLGAFNGGGSTLGRSRDTQSRVVHGNLCASSRAICREE